MTDLLLKTYTAYLDNLLKTKSSEPFTNGGKEYAAELMSRLFANTQREARIYCEGFRAELICEDPYWKSLLQYLEDPARKTLLVMVESGAHMNEAPIQELIKTQRKRGDDTVQLRLIQEDGKKLIEERLSKQHCNFAVFDDSMFRFEYDPEGFKAIGSFNDPKKSRALRTVFDDAFAKAIPLPVNVES